MNASKWLVAGLILLVAAPLAISRAAAAAQADPLAGTWVLNVAKSKYSPGPAPKEQTAVYEAAGKGVKLTAKGVNAAGSPTLVTYSANYDGKDYPVTGSPDFDATSLQRKSDTTVVFTRTRGGKPVQTATSVLSADGKTRTVTVTGVNAQGQKVSNVQVYERK